MQSICYWMDVIDGEQPALLGSQGPTSPSSRGRGRSWRSNSGNEAQELQLKETEIYGRSGKFWDVVQDIVDTALAKLSKSERQTEQNWDDECWEIDSKVAFTFQNVIILFLPTSLEAFI